MNATQINSHAEALKRELAPRYPVQAAMLQKNLRRYAATIGFFGAKLGWDFKGRVLDYGCGLPMFLRLLRDAGFDAGGYEPYPEPGHGEVAAVMGVEQHYYKSLPADAQFDAVTLVDVIEHLSILRPTMTDLLARIKPGGHLVISTPNGLRLSQWLAFMRRKTAHPTSIEKFLETNNNYVNHQREFTRPELEKTMRHYGLQVVSSICVDTMPARKDLDAYHELLGHRSMPSTWRTLTREFLQRSLPADWQNNLFLLARKPASSPGP